MDELAKNRGSIKQSFIRTDPSFRFSSNALNDNSTFAGNSTTQLYESYIDPGDRSVPTDLTIEMENIYHKKKN